MQLKKKIWLIWLVILLVAGCQLSSPHNLETIVVEDYLDYWRLSPNGDYLVYGAPRGKGNFLLNLTTGQKHEFDCQLHWWDSYHFDCYRNLDLFVIDIKTLTETPLVSVDLTKNPMLNVEDLLVTSELIYRPEWITDTVYTLVPDYQLNPKKNYAISGLVNPDEILEKYTYIPIPRGYPKSVDRPTISPNGLYYYGSTVEGFSIFTTNKGEAVVEFTGKGASYLEIGGWATDSSGVYFSMFRGGFGGPGITKEIRKLKIPDE